MTYSSFTKYFFLNDLNLFIFKTLMINLAGIFMIFKGVNLLNSSFLIELIVDQLATLLPLTRNS